MKKVIIVGGLGAIQSGTIQQIALSLVQGASEELAQLKKILAEEYGTEPLIVTETHASEEINPERFKDKPVVVIEAQTMKKVSLEEMEHVLVRKPDVLPEISESVLKQKKRSSVKPYVPKTIGKPCSAPHRGRK